MTLKDLKTKEGIIFVIMGLALAGFLVKEGIDYQNKKQSDYMRAGMEAVISSVMTISEKCQPVTLGIKENKRSFVDVSCLKNADGTPVVAPKTEPVIAPAPEAAAPEVPIVNEAQ